MRFALGLDLGTVGVETGPAGLFLKARRSTIKKKSSHTAGFRALVSGQWSVGLLLWSVSFLPTG
jgi:hypothetical protein